MYFLYCLMYVLRIYNLFEQVQWNLGIPVGLINGDTADIEAMTDNYMKFCIKPIIEKITDELNAKLYSCII